MTVLLILSALIFTLIVMSIIYITIENKQHYVIGTVVNISLGVYLCEIFRSISI